MKLKDLSSHHAETLRKKYPNVPEYAIPHKKFSDKSANELTASIIEAIRQAGGWATRINSGGIYDKKFNGFRQSTTQSGTADVHCCIGGKHISIEIKFGNDKQSEAQQKVQQQIRAAGGLYFIARNWFEFSEWFEKIRK